MIWGLGEERTQRCQRSRCHWTASADVARCSPRAAPRNKVECRSHLGDPPPGWETAIMPLYARPERARKIGAKIEDRDPLLPDVTEQQGKSRESRDSHQEAPGHRCRHDPWREGPVRRDRGRRDHREQRRKLPHSELRSGLPRFRGGPHEAREETGHRIRWEVDLRIRTLHGVLMLL